MSDDWFPIKGLNAATLEAWKRLPENAGDYAGRSPAEAGQPVPADELKGGSSGEG